MEPLPAFKYHPDPVATGSVIADEAPCLSCNRIRGHIYVGPAHSEKFHYLSHAVCPWCIADGSAAERFKATFGDAGTMEDVSDQVMDEIAHRTPGFTAWQQEQWLTCCDDAAAFLGLAGVAELKTQFAGAVAAVKKHLKEEYDLSGKDLQEFFDGLNKDDQPTAYIFRCLHCNEYLAYVDET